MLTPRAAVYFDNLSQRQSGRRAINDRGVDALVAAADAQVRAAFGPTAGVRRTGSESTRSSDQVQYDLFGASAGFGWEGHEAVQVVLSGLYGSADVTANDILSIDSQFFVGSTQVPDVAIIANRSATRLHRLDLEATVQYRRCETVAWVGGLRLEQTRAESTALQTFTSSQNAVNYVAQLLGVPPTLEVGTSSARVTNGATVRLYGGRFGLAAFAPFRERHLFFVNAFLHASFVPAMRTRVVATPVGGGATTVENVSIPSETTVGPDLTVGYMYRFTDRLALDVRYRAIAYFPVSGPYGFNEPRVNHGASIGLSLSIEPRS
ncbi:MAG: hypothetical protein U1F11_06105 [Steroidobacteraceae bacterium]